MPKRTKNYEDSLIESLKNPLEAAEYLNAYLSNDDGQTTEEEFLLALRDIAKAYGMTEIAHKTSLGRESLYKMLSKSGNPKIKTLRILLDSIGLKLSVEPKEAIN